MKMAREGQKGGLVIISEEVKRCPRCDEDKPLTEFNAGRNICKMCQSEYYKCWAALNQDKKRATNRKWIEDHPERKKANNNRWKAKHPEKVKASRKAWRQANPVAERATAERRRAKLKGALSSLTAEEWAEIWQEYDGICFWCPNVATHMDHIVPLTPRPGDPQGHHVKENVVPACQPCNNKKSNKDPLTFLFEMRSNGGTMFQLHSDDQGK